MSDVVKMVRLTIVSKTSPKIIIFIIDICKEAISVSVYRNTLCIIADKKDIDLIGAFTFTNRNFNFINVRRKDPTDTYTEGWIVPKILVFINVEMGIQ